MNDSKQKQTARPSGSEDREDRDLRHARPRDNQPEDFRKARQLARQRRRRKLMITRLLILLSIVLLVALIATAVVVKIVADQKTARGEKVRFLAVTEIQVEGDVRYSDEEVIKASKLYVGQSLLSLNKAKAAKAIVASLPYLDGNRVVVENASFSVLRIKVVEVPVLAAVQVEEDWMILGVNNRAMEKVSADKVPAGLVRIQGASFESKTVGKTLLDERSLRITTTLIEAARTHGLDSMTTIDMSARTRIFIMLNERMQVILGNETNLSNQIKALVQTLPTLYKNNGEDAAGRLDMVFYSDDDKSNNKSIYTPQEVLDKLEQAEQQPMAAVQVGDDWVIINENNLVLETVPEAYVPEDVVRVLGASCETVVVGKELLDVRSLFVCHTVISEAARQEAVSLTAVDIGDANAIVLHLREGLRVMVGDGSTAEKQIQALPDLLPTVWETYGEDASGVVNITSYGDDDPDNDKLVYTAEL